MGNRLKEIRLMRDLKVTEAARRLGVHRDQLHRLERGDRRLTDVWIQKLSRLYNVAPKDLVADSGLTILVELTCGRFVNEQGDIAAPPHHHVETPGFVMQPENCFGAYLRDDSANRLYPPGTTVIARHLHKLGRALKRGDRVVVRHFKTTRAAAERLEDVIGILDRAVNGDLIVLLPTENRLRGGSVTVRVASAGAGAVAAGDTIDYEPQEDDAGEILGVVVAAVIPQ